MKKEGYLEGRLSIEENQLLLFYFDRIVWAMKERGDFREKELE